MFVIYGGLTAVSAIYINFKLPETANKKYGEIVVFFWSPSIHESVDIFDYEKAQESTKDFRFIDLAQKKILHSFDQYGR
jgi:hypothetical protein